ncbi:hypothetical protein AVEN_70825-1 [Araneus ventricosus]|uniref:Uncharacterized protein n=1 Tax=Araneus ventricosus TaxID=182803 RepID=A0A4Y2M0Y7_ARAVE|nr:hypothetical protein AVEN_70825-1 [Araneus ventricosus]
MGLFHSITQEGRLNPVVVESFDDTPPRKVQKTLQFLRFLVPQYQWCIESRNGARVYPTVGRFARQGAQSPRQGMTCSTGGECNEIGLKFSPDYYLSTEVEYPVQNFSRRDTNFFPDGGYLPHPVPPLAPPLMEIPHGRHYLS